MQLQIIMRLKHLIDLGIIEKIGNGRSARYILCQQYYTLARKQGMYTRKKVSLRQA